MAPAEPTTSGNGSKSYAILKLTCDGSNWIMWKSQTLLTLVASCGVMCHIEDTAPAPATIPLIPTNWSLKVDEEEQLEKAEKSHDDYDQ